MSILEFILTSSVSNSVIGPYVKNPEAFILSFPVSAKQIQELQNTGNAFPIVPNSRNFFPIFKMPLPCLPMPPATFYFHTTHQILHSSPNFPFPPTAPSCASGHKVAHLFLFSNSFAWHQGLIVFNLLIYLGHKFSHLLFIYLTSPSSDKIFMSLECC